MSEIALHDRSASSAGLGRRAGTAALAVVTLGVGVWALWPLGPAHAVADAADPTLVAAGAAAFAPRPIDLGKPLDLAAFRTPLWVSPPPPPVPPQPPPPPPPLKLQLIAIIEGEMGHGAIASSPRSALIYDPDQDKLLSLTQGQSVQGRTVERISATGVEIKDQHGTRSLSLKNDPPREGSIAPAKGLAKTAAAPLIKTTPPAQPPAAAVPQPAPATENPENGDAPAPEKKDPAPDPSSAPAPTSTPAPSPPPDPGGTP